MTIQKTTTQLLIALLLFAGACLGGMLTNSADAVVTTIADYRDDFQGTTAPTGWAYQWNGSGAIGTAANYTNLLWDGGSRWDVDGVSGLPGPNPGAFVFAGATDGHPGRGAGEGGGGTDRYAIAGYTVQPGEAGRTLLSAAVGKHQSAGQNGVDVEIYVNNTLTVNRPNVRQSAFTEDLGTLNAGDTVYLAVGPNGLDGSDGFQWDMTLLNLGLGSSVVADRVNDFAGIVKANNQAAQVSDPNTPYRFQWNSSGAIGTEANYSDLLWSGVQFDGNGTGGHPDVDPAAFTLFQALTTHPGRGVSQGAGVDRYAIAGYEIENAGTYDLLTAVARRAASTIDFEIYVNDALLKSFDGTVTESLHQSLGFLAAGDTVYITVGPNINDGGDGTQLDFTLILTVPEPSTFILATFALLSLGLVGTRRRQRA